MRSFLRWFLVLLAVCAGLLLYSGLTGGASPATAHGGAPSKQHAATANPHSPNAAARAAAASWRHLRTTDTRRGIVELLGTRDGSRVGWNRRLAEWGGLVGPHWWQSALAVLTLIHYAEQTNSHSRLVQHVIDVTYTRGVRQPHTDQPFDFINQYMDDTVWWGLAWLNASEYELYYKRNFKDAARFLTVAEKDAIHVAHYTQCGGIVWALNNPAGTITNAEYVALTAELSQYRRTSSRFHDPARAASWLADAQHSLGWLRRVGLVNLAHGTLRDRLAPHQCHSLVGAPLAYTEGEVADALVQLGTTLNQPSYYRVAARFLRYVLNPAHGFVVHGVLQEHCEVDALCTHNSLGNRYDITAFKGIFMTAVSDWTMATGSREFVPFMRAQAGAVIQNSITGSTRGRVCTSAHSCQFAFSWADPFSQTPSAEQLATVGTQESALSALIAALPQAG